MPTIDSSVPVGGTRGFENSEPADDTQYRFAKMQIAQAEQSKSLAKNYMQQIEVLQKVPKAERDDVKIQQLMIHVQESLGQYNAYAGGAKSTISDIIQTAQSMIRS